MMNSIDVRFDNHANQYYSSIDLRKLGHQFQEFEGCGQTLSESLADLSSQLEDAGL